MTQRDQSNTPDVIPRSAPPVAPGVGAYATGRGCVRLMLAFPRVGRDEDTGVPIAYQDMSVADAVQVVQALRQTIDDARNWRTR